MERAQKKVIRSNYLKRKASEAEENLADQMTVAIIVFTLICLVINVITNF